ncbi:MAG TPA: hypothetical protein VD969_29350 [Symbiobacteriaceae bacterium]|nr:hypothetical protein [Symbiobacteriaceae bacterium]
MFNRRGRLLAFAVTICLLLPLVSPGRAHAGASPQAAQGWEHTALLKADGTVWAWGQNYFGGLGNDTTVDSGTPVPVMDLTGVKAIAAGGHKTLALKADGTVWAWGDNSYGQLGNGSTAHSSKPVPVQGLTGVKAIAAGVLHAAALKSDGTVWTWGYGGYGGLGNGDSGPSAMSLTPVPVTGLTGVKAIFASAIAGRTYALKSDGTLWAWGENGQFGGLLGDGTTVELAATPVQVTGLSEVTAVATGASHTIALRSDGTVWAWGYNTDGQFGNGSTSGSPVRTPAQVPGLTKVTAIAAGYSHSLALRSDGTVWTWGGNSQGQLGDGSTDSRTSAARVAGLRDVVQIGAGQSFSVAVRRDGSVWTWGQNAHGQLGDGSTDRRTKPGRVEGLAGAAQAAPPTQPVPPAPAAPAVEPAALAGYIVRYQSYRQALDRYLHALANDLSLRESMLMVGDLLRGGRPDDLRSAMNQFRRYADEYSQQCAAAVPDSGRWLAALTENRTRPPQLKALLAMEKAAAELECRRAIVTYSGKAVGAAFALQLLGTDAPDSGDFQRRYNDWERANSILPRAQGLAAELSAAEAGLTAAGAALEQARAALAAELADVQPQPASLPATAGAGAPLAPEIPPPPAPPVPQFDPAFQEQREANRREIRETRPAAEAAVEVLRALTRSINRYADAGACGDEELAGALRREAAAVEATPIRELELDLQAEAGQREPFWPADPNNALHGIASVWRVLARYRPACPAAEQLKVDVQDAAVRIDEISHRLERRARFWVRILELYRDSGLIEEIPDQDSFAIPGRAADLIHQIGTANPVSYSTTPRQPGAAGAQTPGQPVLVSPADGATGLPTAVTLAWQEVAGSTGYLVEAARDAAFQEMVVSHWTAGTSMIVDGPPGAHVYWRVTAIHGEAHGPAAQPRRFATAAGTEQNTHLRTGIEDLLKAVQEDPVLLTDDWRAKVSLWLSRHLAKYNNLVDLAMKDRRLARDELLTARGALDGGDVAAARQHYQKASALYSTSQALLRGALEIAESGVSITRQAAVALYTGSVEALGFGLAVRSPKAAAVVDWITRGTDYAVNKYAWGTEQANQALTEDLLSAAVSKVLLQRLHIDLNLLSDDPNALPDVAFWIARFVKTEEFRTELILYLNRAGVYLVETQVIDRLAESFAEFGTGSNPAQPPAAAPAPPAAGSPSPRIAGVSPYGSVSFDHGMKVCYPDGTCKVNGTKSWRNNNPGNIRGGTWAAEHGAIGINNEMAVFPTEQMGWQAMIALLTGPTYHFRTIEGAIGRWAPETDGNDTEAYIRYVVTRTGFARQTPMASLTADQLAAMARTMSEHEGWKVGEVQTGVDPAAFPVPARNGLQWAAVRGSGFVPGAQVKLTSLGVPFWIPAERTKFISAAEIRIYANFTAEVAAWTAQVINPGSVESNVFDFSVR